MSPTSIPMRSGPVRISALLTALLLVATASALVAQSVPGPGPGSTDGALDWSLAPRASAEITPEEHAARRAALAALVGDGVLLVPGSAEPPLDYIPFFQNSDFRYLTGFTGSNAVLVAQIEGGTVARETLFVNPRDPATETWEGLRPDPDEIEALTGIPGRPLTDMESVLDGLLAPRPPLFVVGAYRPDAAITNDVTQRIDDILAPHPGLEATVITDRANALRAVKSEAEIERLRMSTAITVEAHRAMMGAMAPGRNEFEIQAIIEYTFRRYGSERPAFASIVGSGPNSTILHYNDNDRFIDAGDMVVVDIGASWGGYAADITRTVPADGRFSEAQAEIYQLVLDAQQAAEVIAAPGVSVAELNAAAGQVLAEGLARLGLIEGPDAWFEDESGRRIPQVQLYYMHGLGHGIGLDVHDPWPSVLEPGVAFTIEPGIYVRANLFEEIVPDTEHNRRMIAEIRPAFDRYVNIGVRIEDDYVVTGEGLEWLSPAPRTIEDIEAAMAEEEDGLGDRRSDWVERHREVR